MAGGAWKVAYADFVTAMMALFMVLWIISQDEKIVEVTSLYFKNPIGETFSKDSGVVSINNSKDGQQKSSSGQDNAATSVVDLAFLNKLAAEFYKLLNIDQSAQDSPVDVKVASDGLHITIFDRSKLPLFVSDSAIFTEWGKYVMQNLAWVMDRYPLKLRIDSHTASGYKPIDPEYGPWELSVDRANATRKLLEHFALETNKVYEVSGFADSDPLPDLPPDAEANQRVVLKLMLH
ncbi:MAG: flagellar motor protein MotB [Verrucomicrobia bacterium CG_4_10_14_3_um_filter_43_23]|nr:MAG: hypothetical protein AUJ82_08255 [Verrucomicrobia bacterium CG1_02_43_26]PIP59937.1 MAG: flagellar motor protein MotB [Verrucomicrobia bacterium CG22_combo_CG10-13_8_21_14_all_43_17]PIX58153.1 MAG: flagellar motor protein MotB [Verrucomicrobia bacterium CG_4_10_14_3_um_filter_43_23]PIY61848.1 MAG: flagellar motor protein MotB [Verrucomicrobia bacterium CG_4_10_14_0_8_um_filter_43_34]PJA44469.1 MAG: flagellar motor protein MotB [Verrucomicrobia bacterium CG_4_9_14_3_um_filter_43_20]